MDEFIISDFKLPGGELVPLTITKQDLFNCIIKCDRGFQFKLIKFIISHIKDSTNADNLEISKLKLKEVELLCAL